MPESFGLVPSDGLLDGLFIWTPGLNGLNPFVPRSKEFGCSIEEPENKNKILKENAKLKLPDDDKKNK